MFNLLDQPALAAQLCLLLLSEDQARERSMKDVSEAEEKPVAAIKKSRKSRMRFSLFRRSSRATA